MSTHPDTMSENANIEDAKSDPKAQGEPSGGSGLGATPCSASVDLCLRMMIRAFYDEVRDRKGSEVKELLLEWFTPEEIEAASEMIRKGVIPPAIDFSFYLQNVQV